MISARDVFQRLGFEADWHAMTDEAPAYRFTCPSFTVSAAQVLSRRFKPCFLLGGVARTKQSKFSISTDLPLEFASFEQGLACVVHALGPEVDPSGAPDWHEVGKTLRGHLPWNLNEANPGEKRSAPL
jgi:hypothetical protein